MKSFRLASYVARPHFKIQNKLPHFKTCPRQVCYPHWELDGWYGASPGSSLSRGSRTPPQTCTCSVLRWTRTRSIDSVPTASVHCCRSWQSSERPLHWCSWFSQAYAPLNGGRIEGLPTFQTVQSWHLRKLTLSRSGRGIHGTCCLSVGHHGKRGSILPETEWGCLQPTASKAV